jgi:phosphate starvation-inducible PhoH-like protein
MIGRERRGRIRRYELPVVAPVQMEPQEVPVDPYVLGLLLGDGSISCRTTPGFTTADPELAVAIEDALPGIELVRKGDYDYVLRHVNGQRGGVIVANPVTVAIRELGLAGATSGAKFVPEVYKRNSVDVRLAVLQGLLDTDGGPVVRPGRTCRVQYSTTSARLRDDVIYLVQSLGGVASWHVREAEGRAPGLANGRPVPYRADAYVLEIRLPEGVSPFRLSRKRERYEEHGGGRPMRFIDSILPAGVQETMCIQVAAEDSLYVTDHFLVTHNTLNDAFIILDEAQNTTPEQMKMFLTRLGFGSKIVVTGDVTQVDLPGGTTSGLRVVREILSNVEDVHFAQLSSADVVRHKLVGEIVDAYARWDAERENQQAQGVHAVPGRTAQGGRAGRRR